MESIESTQHRQSHLLQNLVRHSALAMEDMAELPESINFPLQSLDEVRRLEDELRVEATQNRVVSKSLVTIFQKIYTREKNISGRKQK